MPPAVTWCSCIAWSSAAWVLGGRPVDLVGQHHVGEDRPVHEPERAPAGRQVLLDDLGAGDVARHEVGGELDPVEAELERLRHGLDHERLGEAGHADEERVAARQDRGQDAVHHVFLAHDPLRHLGPQTPTSRRPGARAVGRRPAGTLWVAVMALEYGDPGEIESGRPTRASLRNFSQAGRFAP